MWLKELKIAIIEKNTDKIGKLFDDIPELDKEEDIEQALYLTKEASSLISKLKDQSDFSMKKMKKNIDFLKSTQAPKRNKLDIKL